MAQYKLMSAVKFGRKLITTEDLDPVYCILWNAQLPPNRLRKYLFAYWCFYHMGTAAWIVDQKDFWGAMAQAAADPKAKRGTERRHFRATNAIKAVDTFKSYGLHPRELLEESFREDTEYDLAEVMNAVKKWPQFGPWIAFKVADMLERLDLLDIKFKPMDVMKMFDAPVEGTRLLAQQKSYDGEDYKVWAYDYLVEKLDGLQAPPRYERAINIQEIETVLCKWKSHLNGNYPLGKDTRECVEALREAKATKTGKRLYEAAKKQEQVYFRGK